MPASVKMYLSTRSKQIEKISNGVKGEGKHTNVGEEANPVASMYEREAIRVQRLKDVNRDHSRGLKPMGQMIPHIPRRQTGVPTPV